ncbi:hypothetical protein [Carnobacterium maltaromaticum]|uniref:hypothetical protein n=1 Tax=Carnobacterium maltaromaticum TaxID=2751 RepID=UPI00026C8A4E|nr:hypothetical protein [Carnobacterium maltaromaticum]
MNKLETSNEISKLANNDVLDIVKKKLGITKFKDEEFKVIQPYKDEQAIILIGGLNKNGEYEIEVNVNDFTIILPKKEGSLDVFNDKEEENEK